MNKRYKEHMNKRDIELVKKRIAWLNKNSQSGFKYELDKETQPIFGTRYLVNVRTPDGKMFFNWWNWDQDLKKRLAKQIEHIRTLTIVPSERRPPRKFNGKTYQHFADVRGNWKASTLRAEYNKSDHYKMRAVKIGDNRHALYTRKN